MNAEEQHRLHGGQVEASDDDDGPVPVEDVW
jgi:hypothetical protein